MILFLISSYKALESILILVASWLNFSLISTRRSFFLVFTSSIISYNSFSFFSSTTYIFSPFLGSFDFDKKFNYCWNFFFISYCDANFSSAHFSKNSSISFSFSKSNFSNYNLHYSKSSLIFNSKIDLVVLILLILLGLDIPLIAAPFY